MEMLSGVVKNVGGEDMIHQPAGIFSKMHRKEQLCHSFHRKVRKMSVLLSGVQ